MKKNHYFFKTLFLFLALLVASLPVQAFMPGWWYPVQGKAHPTITNDALDQIYAEYGYDLGLKLCTENMENAKEIMAQNSIDIKQTIPIRTASSSNRKTTPLDNSPFLPDGPEKQKMVKKILDQITVTYGLSLARELPIPTWQPRIGKLYTLHKNLTNNDWILLAEMYISFTASNWKSIAGIPVDFDNDPKGASRLGSAMEILLAMHGEASIETLNSMIAVTHQSPILLDIIKSSIELKPWSNLYEYKKDQQSTNRSSKHGWAEQRDAQLG